MKKHCTWILGLVITLAAAAAQVAGPGGVAPAVKPADPVKNDGPKVIERGANHRKWVHVTQSAGADGQIMLKTNRYTEIGTGLHYQRNGEWVETSETIDIVAGGALAARGPHQVGFPANLNTLGGINVLGPDGGRFRSHVLGLAYTDARTGQSVLIAGIKDSIGTIVGDNQILYPDAFDGAEGVRADVRYTYRASGLEQDVIIKSLPPPEAFQLDSENVRLEVFTEFVESPEPTVAEVVLARTAGAQRAGRVLPDFINQDLNFGGMRMEAGLAFPLAGESERDPESGTPTAKTWTVLDGRKVLIEAVQYPDVKAHLDTLEKPAGRKEARAWPKTSPGRSVPPPPRQARRTETVQRMAALSQPQAGLVIDYNLVLGGVTNFVFQADTTYFVTNNRSVSLFGTPVIEGGTVIKFGQGSSYIPRLSFVGSVDCRTSPYRPATFTSMHDNTVGDIIAGSTGNPTNYCGAPLSLGTGGSALFFNFHDVRVRHASYGFYVTSTVTLDLSHAQFYRNRSAFYANNATLNLRNVLVHRAQFGLETTVTPTNRIEHATFHGVSNLISGTTATLNLTNSLLIGVTNNVRWTGTGVETNLNDAGIFQTVGAGAHYLADPSPYRDAGTTNIQAALRADLRQRTTYPPLVIAPSGYYYGVSQTWFPRAARDTDAPDLGYHYDPLDYAISAIYLTNATITVQPGTAIGVFNVTNTAYYGLALSDGARLQAAGRADARVTFTDYASVQEMANTSWAGPIHSLVHTWGGATGTPELRARFTDFTALGGTTPHLHGNDTSAPWHLTDVQFHGGSLYNYGTAAGLTNVLFNRVFQEITLYADVTNRWYNATFHGGSFNAFSYYGSNSLRLHDSLFTGTILSTEVVSSHIGYVGSARLDATNASDQVLASLAFQTGPLGSFYVPTNTALANNGSRNATNAGLYHYTMLTNNVKETNTTVDLGFHYVATGTNGVPLDYDGDGLPDYWEDLNGNGSTDSGETDWRDANDLGLQVFITRPRVNSPIP